MTDNITDNITDKITANKTIDPWTDNVTRTEHLEWCKKRALKYIEINDISSAWNSICSDLMKYPKTRNHPAISLGTELLLAGHLSTVEEMKKFILGFM